MLRPIIADKVREDLSGLFISPPTIQSWSFDLNAKVKAASMFCADDFLSGKFMKPLKKIWQYYDQIIGCTYGLDCACPICN